MSRLPNQNAKFSEHMCELLPLNQYNLPTQSTKNDWNRWFFDIPAITPSDTNLVALKNNFHVRMLSVSGMPQWFGQQELEPVMGLCCSHWISLPPSSKISSSRPYTSEFLAQAKVSYSHCSEEQRHFLDQTFLGRNHVPSLLASMNYREHKLGPERRAEMHAVRQIQRTLPPCSAAGHAKKEEQNESPLLE